MNADLAVIERQLQLIGVYFIVFACVIIPLVIAHVVHHWKDKEK